MAEVAAIAAEAGIIAAFEPEVSNVVDSALKARRLLDEIASPHLRVVMDASNLFRAGDLPRMREVLDEAFDLLGDDVVLIHAKDLRRDGAAGQEAAGTGVLDYDHYLLRLRRIGWAGPLILHSLSEAQVPAAAAFLRARIAALGEREARRPGGAGGHAPSG
ncbi:MAG: Xylose isomerase-like TIM barrel [Alphaproteobacteria bacterium ADurb.BinA305]|nr:MAG: Xylose isomerase-like TIM barrel [Alphaproteobacteria bacterium ADurb.BinA305]